MKVPNDAAANVMRYLSLSRLQNEGSQPVHKLSAGDGKSIKVTESRFPTLSTRTGAA